MSGRQKHGRTIPRAILLVGILAAGVAVCPASAMAQPVAWWWGGVGNWSGPGNWWPAGPGDPSGPRRQAAGRPGSP